MTAVVWVHVDGEPHLDGICPFNTLLTSAPSVEVTHKLI